MQSPVFLCAHWLNISIIVSECRRLLIGTLGYYSAGGGGLNVTSVHHPAGVHVFDCAAQLHKVLPDRPFWDQPLLLLEVLGRQTQDG